MKKEDTCLLYEKFNYRTPFLFLLPIAESEYSDEMERQRDKSWFFKMQQLEKKSQMLREKMNVLTEKYSIEIRKTREITAKSNYLMKNLYNEE